MKVYHLDDAAAKLLDDLRRAIHPAIMESVEVAVAMAALEDRGFDVEMTVDLALY